jgi:hypothetical protein
LYQRDIKQGHVDAMSGDDFVFDAMGLPFLGLVKGRDGYANVDSRHRLAAYDATYGAEAPNNFITCEVMEFESEEEEAQYFAIRNRTYTVTKSQSFHARFVGKLTPETTIVEIMASVGIEIHSKKTGRNIARGAPFRKVYDTLGHDRFEQFAELLKVYRDEDGDYESKALSSKFVNGLSRFWETFDDEVGVAIHKLRLAKEHAEATAAKICDYTAKKCRDNGEETRKMAVAEYIRKCIQTAKRKERELQPA